MLRATTINGCQAEDITHYIICVETGDCFNQDIYINMRPIKFEMGVARLKYISIYDLYEAFFMNEGSAPRTKYSFL